MGSLKAHEERVKGKIESSGGQLLLIEEEWSRIESEEKKLLFTREEWQRRSNKNETDAATNQRRHGARDKSRVQCYNCNIYGHYAAECRRQKKIKEQRQESNLAQVEDDEPALLLAKCDKEEGDMKLLNKKQVIPALFADSEEKRVESNVWYLDNRASNHMTGYKSKFTELNKGITGLV